jgi:hypothetical protein
VFSAARIVLVSNFVELRLEIRHGKCRAEHLAQRMCAARRRIAEDLPVREANHLEREFRAIESGAGVGCGATDELLRGALEVQHAGRTGAEEDVEIGVGNVLRGVGIARSDRSVESVGRSRRAEQHPELHTLARLLEMHDRGHAVKQCQQHRGGEPFEAQQLDAVGIGLGNDLVIGAHLLAIGAHVHGRPSRDRA